MPGLTCLPYRTSIVSLLALAVALADISPGLAVEREGGAQVEGTSPITSLLAWQLNAMELLAIVVCASAVILLASYAFASEKVTIFEIPTMPKYTVSWLTYRSFTFLYVVIVLAIFVLVIENYGLVRAWLVSLNEAFATLPEGGNVFAASVGAVAVVAALHYMKLPNSQIGPSWFLYQLRRLLHWRARIPETAQFLAGKFLSDETSVFEVPAAKQVDTVERFPSVAPADFGADKITIDYKWAMVTYLYKIGVDYSTSAPYSSFAANRASLWSEIQRDYQNLQFRVQTAKRGDGDDAFEGGVREDIDKLRRNLSIFHACMHLFAAQNDVERLTTLKALGVKDQCIFFVFNRNLAAKFLVFIACGIAAPPLVFGIGSLITGMGPFGPYAEPAMILTWVLVGTPMYILPIVLVMLMKRFMAASWPIRATFESVKDDPASHHRADFKFDIYIFIFLVSFGLASIPLLIHNASFQQAVSLWWALTPAAAAVALAVLIDVDVVDGGGPSGFSCAPRRKVVTQRAIGFGVLLGGLVTYLMSTIIDDAPTSQLVLVGLTGASMGIMIGIRSDFNENAKTV